METKRLGYLVLPVALGFAAVLVMISLMSASPASAQARTGSMEKLDPAEDPVIYYFVALTNSIDLEITDPLGNLIGEGVHGGEMMCANDHCSRGTQLYFISPLIETTYYEYKFKDSLARDPEAGVVVVSGKGTISNGDKKERFIFTATIVDNRDGTLFVRYDASIPEASFIVPRSPGRMEF